MSTPEADRPGAITEEVTLEIQDAFEALEDNEELDWSSFETLLDKAIAAGVLNVEGNFPFRVFKRAPPPSVFAKQLKVVPVYDNAWKLCTLHQVVEHIADESYSSEYTIEHLKLIQEFNCHRIDIMHLNGEGERDEENISTLDFLFPKALYTIDYFERVLVCAKWMIDESPNLLFQNKGTWTWVCRSIGEAIQQLQPYESSQPDDAAVVSIMLESFIPIFKVFCQEMCITTEVCLLQLGKISNDLQQFLLRNRRIVSDEPKFSLEIALSSSHYGDDCRFWSVVTETQPESLREKSRKLGFVFSQLLLPTTAQSR